MNRNPNDPNKGMDTRVFLISVLVSTVLIFVGILVFLKAKKTSGEPKVTSPNPAKSQLEAPVTKDRIELAVAAGPHSLLRAGRTT